MDLYLNDWSFSCSGKLNEQWEVITRFGDLVRTLRNKGIDKIIFPANYKNINLGNLQWSECYYYTNELKDKGFSEDQCKELISLIDNSIRKPNDNEIDENIVFSNTETFAQSSHFLGKAYDLDLPVVSFTFTNEFEKDAISGFLKKGKNKKLDRVDVKNLFDSSCIDIHSLVSFKECKRMNAEEYPMWNQEHTQRYLKSIGHQSDRKSSDSNEKRAYLIKHGSIIAELNGWKLHEKFTKKNSKKGPTRVIFYSKEFRHKDTYLCIDLEHEDFHFELCDCTGCHLKEIDHTGKQTSGPTEHHNIDV